MVSIKKRLYVAVYPSGVTGDEERRYHWGFLVGPKIESQSEVPGTRYHVKSHYTQGWVYEEASLRNVRTTYNLLVRVLVAKVEDEAQLARILREIPIVQHDQQWDCRTWLAEALSRLAEDGRAVGRAQLDWRKIEPLACDYVTKKIAEGRYSTSEALLQPKPTWDIVEGKEIVR